MSWVLILSPRDGARHPAIVGGYRTREEAEAAGRVATFADINTDEEYPAIDNPYWWRQFEAYTVIPGAADTPPEAA